ncbi:MAG TPA: hypothetical protein VHZ05_10075 [Acidimicrobiales bacterium]|nr:hypothetical protein [Acidimicrobiales bacterium]
MDTAGLSNLGTIVSLAALLAVLLIVAIVVSLTLPSNSTTSTTSSSTISSSSFPATTTTRAGLSVTQSAADVAACRSDVTDVQTALAAYQATNGVYPAPPADWAAGSYPTNFAPLTDAAPPGPFLKMPPADNRYVILWDRSGRVWVEPPGTFFPTYDAANDGANPATCTRVVR